MIEFRIINTTVLCLLAPFLVWPASALLVNTALGRWCVGMSQYSFFIFVAHAPLLLGSWMVYKKMAAFLPYPVYWTLAPLLTVAVLVQAYGLAQRAAPHAFAFMLGKRVAKPVPAVVQPSATRAGAECPNEEALPVQS